MKGFFYNFFENIVRVFWKKNLLWHFLAIALTFIIVTTDLDWSYYLATRNQILQTVLFPAVVLGGLLPIVFPILIFAYSRLNKNFKLQNTSFALGQAAILGALVSGFYKALTGRVPPEFHRAEPLLTDISKQFQFGLFRGGVFWGWPSTHTTIAFAMSLALFTLYPGKKWVRVLAILYAFYIGIGISISIHWFSEFVAGAIIGSVIGITVGKNFLARIQKPA